MSHTSHRSFFFDIKDIYHVDWDDFDLPLDKLQVQQHIHKVALLAYVLLHMYGKYICIQDPEVAWNRKKIDIYSDKFITISTSARNAYVHTGSTSTERLIFSVNNDDTIL